MLGPRFIHSGHSSDLEGLRSAAVRVLNDLASRSGLIAYLGVMQGGFVDYVDKIGAGVDASVPSRIGTRIFAPATTCGTAILASLEPEEVDSIIFHSGVDRADDSHELHRELGAIRRRKGVAYRDVRERPSGVNSVGAAIVGPDGPVGAISIARRGSISIRAFGPLVLRAADSVAVELFGRSARTPG